MNNASNLALVASNSGQPLTPKVVELDQRIATLELEKSSLSNIDPHELERRIQEHAARAIPGLDGAPEALKVLQQLIASKEQVVQHQARRIAIDNELRHLNIERNSEIADQERYRLDDARKEFEAAYSEFVASARQMCRSYQRAYQIDRKHASRLPRYGAHNLPAFDISIFNPTGWQGITSQYVVDGSLPWLKEGS